MIGIRPSRIYGFMAGLAAFQPFGTVRTGVTIDAALTLRRTKGDVPFRGRIFSCSVRWNMALAARDGGVSTAQGVEAVVIKHRRRLPMFLIMAAGAIHNPTPFMRIGMASDTHLLQT